MVVAFLMVNKTKLNATPATTIKSWIKVESVSISTNNVHVENTLIIVPTLANSVSKDAWIVLTRPPATNVSKSYS